LVENRVQTYLTKFSGITKYYPLSVVLCDKRTDIISIELFRSNDNFEVNIYSISKTSTLHKTKLTGVTCLLYYVTDIYDDIAFNLN
jgi:hypothetical protein